MRAQVTRRLVSALLTAMAFATSLALMTTASAEMTESESWKNLKKDVFAGREITDGTGMMTLDAPIRAEDAAVVPLTIKMPGSFAANVKAMTIVVDQNPAPVVAAISYGSAAGKGDRMLATRIRMDQYSDVRVIAETTDGKLYMISKYVKASGGCSAPASKDAEEAAKTIGKMQIKTAIAKSSDGLAQEAQIMIKHPNTSGMQMDQLTGLYTPARYVNKIEVKTGSNVVFTMTGNISISEDPNFRFTYEGKPSDPMEVRAEDSNGTQFAGQSTSNPS